MFDSHAHYDDRVFNEDRDGLLGSMRENGVTHIVNASDTLKNSYASVKLAEEYDFIYAAVGLHPHNAKEYSQKTEEELLALSKHKKVVAIGEIGLDYHYDHSPREMQKKVFAMQMELAHKAGLPVVIHQREALSDCLDILRACEVTKIGGIMHCFSESAQTLEIILKMGMYISLGGVVTYKNARKTVEVAAAVPIDRLLLETDCPYLTPEPHRGKRNDSLLMRHTAEKIAQIRGISFEELERQTTENAKRFFGIN